MASAGTGKTWLLVTRLVRLLLDGIQPDAILAITFTRKAAAEMQSRLAQRLHELAVADRQQLPELLTGMGAPPREELLLRARRLYEVMLQSPQMVRTTTFHAFCQEILRRFPLEAEVPPGFELLESSGYLEQEAWNALFEEATAQPDTAVARALETLFHCCGGLFNTEKALLDFLEHRSEWWAFTDGEQYPAEYARQRLQTQLGIEPEEDPVAAFFVPQRREQLMEFANLLTLHNTATNNRLAQSLFQILETPPLERHFDAIQSLFLTQSKQPRKYTPNKTRAKAMGDAGQERFLQLHDTLSNAILETLERLAARHTLQLSAAWYLAGNRLTEHYQRIKEEQRLLDFTDLEWRCYRLLTTAGNAHWIQYKLDQRIEHLLVDEFQDTNPTQWRLILPLLEEMAAGDPERRRSVFLVGDSKQSIYRFRRAEPRLFDTAHRWLATHLDAKSYPMDNSWRSAPAIMEFVNKLFGDGELKRHLPQFHAHDTHLGQLWGKVELLPLIEPEEKSDTVPANQLRNPLLEPRATATDLRYYREGEQIAATIQSLIRQPVTITDNGRERPIDYGDILILIARRTNLPDIESALRAANIPYLGANRGTLLECQEIRDMEALLETLITPYNNLSLAVVLRSPLFACPDQDLITLTTAGDGSWWERLMEHPFPSGTPLARARHWLTLWREMAGHLPVHDLLQRIYSEGNLVARYRAAFPPHLRQRVAANLGRFLHLALEVDSGRYPSLMHFLARLRDLRELKQDAPDEAPPAEGESQVRLMTIHAAKGLEAPVVFLADSASNSIQNRAWSSLVEWPAEQDRPEHFLLAGRGGDADPLTRSLLERQAGEQQREDANLLYVAVTRARQLLYISASAPRRGEKMGWYGQIEEQFRNQLDGSRSGGILCESGVPGRVPTTESPQPPAPESLPPDPRLQHPIQTIPPEREIAPSRQEGYSRAGGDPDGQQRGIVIHRLLELLTGKHPPGKEAVIRQVAAELDIHDTALLERSLYEARTVLRDPALSFLFDPAHYMDARNEVPLLYERDGTMVHGIIDRLLLTPESVIIVDYKTHQSASADTVAQLAESYAHQLSLYRNGVQKLWPERPVRALLLFTACRLIHEF